MSSLSGGHSSYLFDNTVSPDVIVKVRSFRQESRRLAPVSCPKAWSGSINQERFAQLLHTRAVHAEMHGALPVPHINRRSAGVKPAERQQAATAGPSEFRLTKELSNGSPAGGNSPICSIVLQLWT